MGNVTRAVWYIESHLDGPLDLDAIAGAVGLSRFQLCRAFATGPGIPAMTYVRNRRLSRAARRLAAGAPDILQVALEAGYGSHEAFTRAFRERFGLTPDAVRNRARLDDLDIQDIPAMQDQPAITLDPPRLEQHAAFEVAGLSERFAIGHAEAIPALWAAASAHFGAIPAASPAVAYGVSDAFLEEGSYRYTAGLATAPGAVLPAGLDRVKVPAARYAVFSHEGHVSAMTGVFRAIWNDWQPGSGQVIADQPCFERYDHRFDPSTGRGLVEIWVPLRGRAAR